MTPPYMGATTIVQIATLAGSLAMTHLWGLLIGLQISISLRFSE